MTGDTAERSFAALEVLFPQATPLPATARNINVPEYLSQIRSARDLVCGSMKNVDDTLKDASVYVALFSCLIHCSSTLHWFHSVTTSNRIPLDSDLCSPECRQRIHAVPSCCHAAPNQDKILLRAACASSLVCVCQHN
jgi:hypothetical protein